MRGLSIYDTRLREFKEMISEVEYLKYTLNSLIYWDKITYMPEEGIEYRTKVMSYLADKQYKLMSGPKFAAHVKFFKNNKRNDKITDSMVKRICRNSEFVSKVPEEEYSRYIELVAVSEQVWEEAKNKNDFQIFRPYLEEIFDTFRRFASYWSEGGDSYDALLNYYEEGLTTKKVDETAKKIKPFLIEMAAEAKEAGVYGRERLKIGPVDGARQQQLWRTVLADMGFSFSAGRVDIGSHPTILANSPQDVRVVSSYAEKDMRFGLFNALHSGGKGIYQQSIDKGLLGTFLAEAPSFSMEEAIGRFYENVVGRSRGFWTYFYDKMCTIVGELKGFQPEDLYADVNKIGPSLIRIDADQFTYLLHIIIRYELERQIIEGQLKVEDLPKAWNDKYRDYLGMIPSCDREGVLQDIHWAAGYVGYFPSYFISNLSAAQIAAAIEREEGSLDSVISEGRFGVIKSWLHEKIFRYGAVYNTEELVEYATGKPLAAEDYMDYLRKRFSEVYKF